MKKLVFVMFMASAVGVSAQDRDERTFIRELAGVLASEEICGLNYGQDAIRALINENVSPDSLSFAQDLDMRVQGNAYLYEAQGESARTAHCAAITLAARHYGFID